MCIKFRQYYLSKLPVASKHFKVKTIKLTKNKIKYLTINEIDLVTIVISAGVCHIGEGLITFKKLDPYIPSFNTLSSVVFCSFR